MTARERSSTRTSDERLSVRSLRLLVTIGLAACGGSNAVAPRGLSIVLGAGQTDTVLSVMPVPLVVALHEPGAVGQIVQFQTIADTGAAAGGQPFAFLQPTDTTSLPATQLAVTTDANGAARVYVRLNQSAQRGAIIVRVPVFGIVDTVPETATPGAPIRLQKQNDTAVVVGATDTLHAAMYDQYGNRRPNDTITYRVISGPITLSGKAVTGTALGVAVVSANARGAYAPDTTTISVVPQGTIAFGTDAGIVVSNLDGSQASVFPYQNIGNVRWSPDGKTIAFDQGSHGFSTGSGWLRSLTISDGTIMTIDSGAIGHYWPEFSRDGTWLYWTDILEGAGYSSVLWRAHPDGTMKDSIPMTDSSWTSSPSGDGSQLVYSDLTYSGLHIFTLATSAETTLPVQGFAPRWAPTGASIAYLAISQAGGGPIDIIQADGTNNRVVRANNYDFGVDWSPDGQWLISQNDHTTNFDIINVKTGMTLPLPFTNTNTWSPSWGPSGAYPISHAQSLAIGARPRGAHAGR
jgi:Tol biopolymer transport system component